ncbi:MAG: hypothetical protein C0408_01300 [Odoribacter sp.]|nr:hypothetical protein [Odoribacter sp.]
MKTKVFLMIMALAVFSFSSCNKDTTPIEPVSAELVDDDAVTNVAFEDVFNTVDNATIILENMMVGKGDLESNVVLGDSCPIVIIANPPTGIWPKTITIDFGTGCTGYYGNTRSGKIIISVTERRYVTNATRTVSFENYFFNTIKIEGTKEFKNLGPNSNQKMVFSIKLTGGKITLPDGKTIERAFEHQREFIAGWNTPKNIWDDECLITGTATGKNINGISYTNTILTALHWKRVCEFLVAGSIKFERSGVDPVVLDYGKGECDAIATLTRGDQTKEILLRHKHRLMP